MLLPAQTVVEVLFAVTVGSAFTVIRVLSMFVQPLASVPVTVYEPVAAGVKETPSVTPPVQLYVDAPLPVSVTLLPAQMLLALALAVTKGRGLTVIVTDAVFVQPAPFEPVTVYVAVIGGMNDTPSLTPPVHEYVVAPPPVSVTLPPSQTIVAVALAVTLGSAPTVTVTLVVFVQPFASVPVTV
jgi:hypothetical protein